MKKNILLALIAALALALGLSSVATAGVDDSAQASAKKGKGCKGKGKGKTGKSAAASAKKGKGCKGKGATGGWPPSSGTYKDAANEVELTISGKTATVSFIPPGFCVPINYTSEPVPLTSTPSTLRASESRTVSIAGYPTPTKWSISVSKSLSYQLSIDMATTTEIGPCKSNTTITGTLSKIG